MKKCLIHFLCSLIAGICLPEMLSAQVPYNLTPGYTNFSPEGSPFLPDTTVNKKRLVVVSAMTVGAYTIAYTGLGVAWYSNSVRSDFHWFNDMKEWKQIDKLGHMFGGYQGGRCMIQLLKWTGMKKAPSAIIGGAFSFLALTPIEIFDGYSADWGASAPDIAANFLGASVSTANELLWEEQRIQIKLSFHPTSYAEIRPDLLGEGASAWVKDYNGHTIWASFRVHSFLPEGKFKEGWPKWLNFAVGYGAEGLIGGYDDPDEAWKKREWRQYYVTMDIDLSMIKTKSGLANFLLGTFSFVHLPFPAVEFSNKGVKFYGLYW